MRLWSLHPRHLDRAGLTAVWREGLLAQAVLAGRTRGYTRHPQLDRFRAAADPSASIAAYLRGVHVEALARGYAFDATRIDGLPHSDQTDDALEPAHELQGTILVTDGQLALELAHLRAKLEARAPECAALLPERDPEPHPLFCVHAGPVEPWERASAT